MHKRSALAIAAGLVLTLIVGGLAVAVGMTGPTVSSAVPRVERRSSPEPIVRTIRRTVTVHEKADPKPGEVVQIAASTPASSTDGSGSDDSSGTSGDDSNGTYEDDDADENEHEDDGDQNEGDHEDGAGSDD